MKNGKIGPVIIFYILTALMFSCVSLQDRTTMVQERNEAEIIGSVTAEFISNVIYPENNIGIINFRIKDECGIEKIIFENIYISEIKLGKIVFDNIALLFKFTDEGRIEFSKLSKIYLGKIIYLYCDEILIISARLLTEINDGELQLSASDDEMKQIIKILVDKNILPLNALEKIE